MDGGCRQPFSKLIKGITTCPPVFLKTNKSKVVVFIVKVVYGCISGGMVWISGGMLGNRPAEMLGIFVDVGDRR
jgi:hypothetical protein